MQSNEFITHMNTFCVLMKLDTKKRAERLIFSLPGMGRGFVKLIELMNKFQGFSFQRVCAQENPLAIAC
ncbi:MAG: hypothetical protein BRC50_04635 [Cyanobacteria bacterium SW_11_48_12]|nr:MAG: hypothetical protein BRC50_04635 [Cyanobacteria bacterium SW_11_48_12]